MIAALALTVAQLFATITASMHKDEVRHDWASYRSDASRLVQLLNGSPDALLEVARAQARQHDAPDALATLETIARMGESGATVRTLPEFGDLRSGAGYRHVMTLMSRNDARISRAKIGFYISDSRLLPEDIAYDPGLRRFLLTSVLEDRIVWAAPDGRLTAFATSPDGWPMLAVRIDERRQVVWATEAALSGFDSVPKREWGRSAILEYDLRTGVLLHRIEGPRPSQLGDMTLESDGDLIVADSNGGGIFLERAGAALRPIDARDFISPMTPATSDRGPIFIADYVRGIAAFEPAAPVVRWIPMENAYALQGIDGLYYRNRCLIAIQNGMAPERIIVLHLDQALERVTSLTTIESGGTGVDPNHGTIVGNTFYFIDNAGWNQLDPSGRVMKGHALTGARVMQVNLSGL